MSPSSSGSDLVRSDITGSAALVTGGTRGLGRRIAERLALAGASVLVCGRRPPDDLPSGIAFVAADVRDADAAAMAVRSAVDRFGKLDLLVNNAGGGPPMPAAEVPPNLALAIVRLNLLAPLYVAQAAYAVMKDSGGLIINIGSVAALRPAHGTAIYAAAKAGLATLTQALAQEWAPTVRVNCITVGLARTDTNAVHYGDEEALAAVARTIPLGRMATGDDVADACLLLASPLAGYITGANILLDGGGQVQPWTTAREG